MRMSRSAWIAVATLAVVAGLFAGGAFLLGRISSLASLPPASSSTTVLRPNANVIRAIQDLERLESVTFHMERVIDLTEKQSRLFGLIESEDALLLVAAADVRAGVDLQKLEPGDVQVDIERRRARITLPAAEIFGEALDNRRTYVHTRRTGILARRQENLETRARVEAERALREAALEAGILARADANAARIVDGLTRSLGYQDVDVRTRARDRH